VEDKADPLLRVTAASVVATVAFWAYSRTLLPGVDLGDTGGFQAAAVWRETSSRESYPLYFALGEAFMRAVSPANPARGLNLFSSVCGALAAGVLTFVAAGVARSVLGGAIAGLLLACSYTFWSQAILAEVYTLHLMLVALCLAALAAYQRHPSRGRLTTFFGVYALSFGNHYSMILLLIPFTLFLVQAHPRPRELFRAPTIATALGVAAAAVLVYTGNFLATWTAFDSPTSWFDRLGAFWFDVTKSDWRETMVLGIPETRLGDRLAMWWWDARQQFGIPGLLLAITGVVVLWVRARPWAVLVVTSYGVAAAFALTYNVGDVHVFFLPAHFFTALAAGAAFSSRDGTPDDGSYRRVIVAAALVAIVYAGWRGWDTWPAVDRHEDRRASQLIARVTQGLDARDALLIAALDWQTENALLYNARHGLRSLAWARLADVFPHLPFLVEDNAAIGRSIALTADAASAIVAAYGPLFPIVPDEGVRTQSVAEIAGQLPGGTPYVLSVLPASGADRIDPAELGAALQALTGSAIAPADASYQVWAGTTGTRPAVARSEARPFRQAFTIGEDRFTVRMESWLPDDTFRRAGFGRVLRNRDPVLTIERGISLVWLRPDGTPSQIYASGLYAPRPRFRIPARTAIFALCSKSCGAPFSY
jgi:hypothetical protein